MKQDPINLAAFDLNLLVVFDAMMEERNVTRVGRRIALSQPAVSASLNRLRQALGDELFVRKANRMEPTPRALELAGPVRQALTGIQGALAPSVFDARTAQRRFRIATNDFASSVLLPRLVERVHADAPDVALRVIAAGESEARLMLARGDVELAIGPFREAGELESREELIAPEDFLCVMRRGHPLARRRLTLEAFSEAYQLLVSQGGDDVGFVDHILAEAGLRRRVAVIVPHFLVAPLILARSDLIATLPMRLAESFQELADVVAVRPPFPQPRFCLAMLWLRKQEDDAGLAWVREQLVATASRGPRGTR